MNFSQLTIFTAEDRKKIHSTQQAVDYRLLKWLMSNPVKNQSAEYNDNRISLFVGQYGKCYVTGMKLLISEIHCHHKKPKAQGGTDEYNNLVIVCDKGHILIHATKEETIKKYLEELMLEKEEMKRLNKLRKAVGNNPL